MDVYEIGPSPLQKIFAAFVGIIGIVIGVLAAAICLTYQNIDGKSSIMFGTASAMCLIVAILALSVASKTNRFVFLH